MMTDTTPINKAEYLSKQNDLKPPANSMPEIGFLRKPQVLAMIPISSSSWYQGIADGIYPAPVKLSERTSAWRVEDIRKLIADLGAVA
ncbi:MAG: AlpA family phage regulatory protein [Ghiorsea sp.]